jgi:isopentenyl-diphosphate delta-isomerase
MKTIKTKNRKNDHIDLATKSQVVSKDSLGVFYEPMLFSHPGSELSLSSFGPWKFGIPLWISSMTGGAKQAHLINKRLASAARHFQLGMGLGSCRPVLEFMERKLVRKSLARDFLWRGLIGDRPLFANLGLAQVEELIATGRTLKIREMLDFLEVDGLCLHVNPLQEWLQPEGDRWQTSPLDIIKRLFDSFKVETNLIVKEVGQGMGPQSLCELGKLPLMAVEFGALGGTNFALLELQRLQNKKDFQSRNHPLEEMTRWGHSATEMCSWVKALKEKNEFIPRVIISGGIREFTPFFSWIKTFRSLECEALVGLGFPFMQKAIEGEKSLHIYLEELQSLYKMHEQFINPVAEKILRT